MRTFRSVFCSLLLLICGAAKSAMCSDHQPQVVVSQRAATLVKPLLDLREQSVSECGEPGSPSKCTSGEAYNRQRARSRRFGELLQGLIKQNHSGADEALVTLMCFQIGESQEELDAVIKRGKRMLPLLKKYKENRPVIKGNKYPDSIYRSTSSKEEYFDSAIRAIKAGRSGSSD